MELTGSAQVHRISWDMLGHRVEANLANLVMFFVLVRMDMLVHICIF